MKDSIFHKTDLLTPAYVYDQARILTVLERLVDLKEQTGCLPLYSIKSANMISLLEYIKPYISGFSCSSLFEVQLAREVLDNKQTIHVTTPGLRENELDKVIELSDFVTLNSQSQLSRYSERINSKASCGVRINPELSFVTDERYDPCRSYSKLGIPLNKIIKKETNEELNWQSIEGLHIHNNCESNNFDELEQTVRQVMTGLDSNELDLKWINLGGGYLINNQSDLTPLIDTIKWLQDSYAVDVYIEPGKAITGNAGYLVATVIDLFENDDKHIAVLDTSINHMPEVFEYQFQPIVMNACNKSDHEFRLVGCSCLSGDLFGDYYLDKPLELGSRIVFENIGAYMQVKANTFNGINLPATYFLDSESNFILLKQYDYESFRSRL